jgi:hypothetical protein
VAVKEFHMLEEHGVLMIPEKDKMTKNVVGFYRKDNSQLKIFVFSNKGNINIKY